MAIRNCLVSCIKDPSFGCDNIVRSVADDKEVLSPFVVVSFNSGKDFITVGNESYSLGSPPHTAVITSFEHGASSSQKCIITMHDIEGGAFHKFLQKLVKDPKDLVEPEDFLMVVKYGWVYSKCGSKNGGVHKSSRNIYFLPDNIQTVYGGGKIMFNIEGTELLGPGEEFRTSEIFGQEGQEMHLTDAIRELLIKLPAPIVKKVEFLSADGKSELIWQGSGDEAKKGPKGIWHSNQLSKKTTIEKWLSSAGAISKDGKGLILQWNGGDPTPTLRIIEDAKPKCTERLKKDCVATYIINGGNCSTVLEFNPKFNWIWQYRAASGGWQNPTNVSTEVAKGPEACPAPIGTGTTSTNPTNNRDIAIAGGDAGRESNKTKVAQENANIVYGEHIEANLVLQGDPRDEYTSTVIKNFWYVGIVAINPFHLQNFDGNSSCPEFLVHSEHVCNAVLTSSEWMIKGVNHFIKEGSYITTLNIFVAKHVVEEKLKRVFEK